MTEQLFFDTDCVSSFLWVGRENILLSLYPGSSILVCEGLTYQVGGIGKRVYFDYFKDSPQAYALTIKKVLRYEKNAS